MNIRNRINKLQKLTNAGGEFCVCHGSNTEVYISNLGANSVDPTPKLSSNPVDDVCSSCRKEIKKEVIIIQGVDHTTKDRFPDQWNTNRRISHANQKSS